MKVTPSEVHGNALLWSIGTSLGIRLIWEGGKFYVNPSQDDPESGKKELFDPLNNPSQANDILNLTSPCLIRKTENGLFVANSLTEFSLDDLEAYGKTPLEAEIRLFVTRNKGELFSIPGSLIRDPQFDKDISVIREYEQHPLTIQVQMVDEDEPDVLYFLNFTVNIKEDNLELAEVWKSQGKHIRPEPFPITEAELLKITKGIRERAYNVLSTFDHLQYRETKNYSELDSGSLIANVDERLMELMDQVSMDHNTM